MDDKRNKIIAGVVIIVVVIAVIFLFASESSVKCELGEVEPAFDLKNQQNVKSSDNKALVDFDGFLNYEKSDKNDKKVYLPLNFESVSYNENEVNQTLLGKMTLKTNCATLDFNYILRENRAALSVTDIDVSLTLPNGDFKTCKVKQPEIYRGDAKLHYSCEHRKEYNCEATVKQDNNDVSKMVAKLVLGVFKFELGGDPEKIKNLEFSTGEEKCHWAN